MNIFVDVSVEHGACLGVTKCGKCVTVCPVTIFAGDHKAEGSESDFPRIIEDNLDECTLCDLCIQQCEPDAIRVKKLYE